MVTLTILNTLAILFILFNQNIIKIDIHRDETFWNKTLIGYDVWFMGKYFRIPVRNKRKTELSEEVLQLIKTNNPRHITQTLTAIFSWLKTWEEVRQFEKDYSIVDKDTVDRLVNSFVPKI